MGKTLGACLKELSVFRVDVYDPSEPGPDQYLFYVHFDPAVKRDYSTGVEFHMAARIIAEKLIQRDASLNPRFINRLRYYANLVSLDVDSLRTAGYTLGAGLTLWIERSPEWSRLRNEVHLRVLISQMQSEVQAQVQARQLSASI
ncbi:MAG: hypothetical protein WB586_05735 [Chthoniobacterales bacterium]